jgi:hypothetical protein
MAARIEIGSGLQALPRPNMSNDYRPNGHCKAACIAWGRLAGRHGGAPPAKAPR